MQLVKSKPQIHLYEPVVVGVETASDVKAIGLQPAGALELTIGGEGGALELTLTIVGEVG